MLQERNKLSTIGSFIFDLILLAISFYAANFVWFGGFKPEIFYYSLLAGWIVLWIFIVLKYNLYELPRILFIDKVLSKYFKALVVYGVISACAIYFLTTYKFSRPFFVIALSFYTFSLLTTRALWLYVLKKRRNKYLETTSIVIVGVNRNVRKLIKRVYTNAQYGFNLEGVFTTAAMDGDFRDLKKGELIDTIAFLEQNAIDELIISLPNSYAEFINELMVYADNHMIRVSVIPEFSEYLSQMFSIDYIENIPVMKFRKEPLQSLSNRILKRCFDLVLSSLTILLVFTWLFPIIAILIKLTSKGPVFFGQERTGRNGVTFKCWKFRSMTVNNNSDELQATKNDARITPIGAILRKTSLDELPQVFNVFFNNMSLVGPRPHMLKHTEEYRQLVDKFMVRHFAKPGLTGWAQILGYRGETKTVEDMKKRADADIWYIENWSFMLDLKIILRTAYMVLFKKEENAF